MGQKKKRWLLNLLLLFGGSILAILLTEAALRIAGFENQIFYSPDEYRGFARKPGTQGWWRIEGEAYIRINSDGLRDEEHSKLKPKNTLRIAVLGDSYAEALQLPIEKTFWKAMERELNTCGYFGGMKIEVINFGVSGYGTAQELITLREKAWAYSPDIVILAFYPGNDVIDNSKILNGRSDMPYFYYNNDILTLDDSFKHSLKFQIKLSPLGKVLMWIKNNSRILQLVNRARIKIEQQKVVSWNFKGRTIGIDSMGFIEPEGDEIWNEAWRVTEALIVLMRDEVRSHGAGFLVVTLTDSRQVNPDPLTRIEFMKNLEIEDLFYVDSRIKALGEHEGFNVLNLAAPFQAYAEKNKIYLHGFENADPHGGHWNADGHRFAGKLIAQKICEVFAAKNKNPLK